MTSLIDKYKGLEIAIKVRLASKMLRKGEESAFSNNRVLKVKKDEQQYNIAGTYVVEISNDVLIGKNGYEYHHSALTIEQLCELIDSI